MKNTLVVLTLAAAVSLAAGCRAPRRVVLRRPARTLSLTGYGEVQTTPDLATVRLKVVTHAATAAAAQESNSAIAAKVVEAATKKLGDKGKVWTENYIVNPIYKEYPPNYRYPRPEVPPVTGYETRNIIVVRTGDFKLIGPVIDAAIAAGANGVDALNFTLSNPLKARGEAVTRAAQDVEAQLKALAIIGVRHTRLVNLSVGLPQQYPQPVILGRAAMAAGSAPSAVEMGRFVTPVRPHQIGVSATVSVTYRIE